MRNFLLRQKERCLSVKSLSILKRLSFASGVDVLRMRDGPFGIRLSVGSMKKKEGGSLLQR